MKEVYQRTCDRKRHLEQQGLHVTELWECELNQQLKENPDMKQFFDDCQIEPPINPRDAFFGGRTNATILYYKTEPDEKIHYTDVLSLYPWDVNMDVFLWGIQQ